MKPSSALLPVVGWHERITLPDLGIESVFAKLDTGADSSSLHATAIALVEDGGQSFAEFTAPLLRRQAECTGWPPGGVRRVRAPIVDERIVRSSNGEEETRPVVETTVQLGEAVFQARFSLTNREGMRFSVLIGRDALSGRFLVSSGHAHLA